MSVLLLINFLFVYDLTIRYIAEKDYSIGVKRKSAFWRGTELLVYFRFIF